MAAVQNNFTEEYCVPAQNITFLNVTKVNPIDYAIPLYGFVFPILCGITVVVNTIAIAVLSKPHMRSPTNLVLLATAVSDTLTLLFPTPWFIYMYTFGNHHKPLYPVYACNGFWLMTTVIPGLFHASSIWLTLLLALQRYICVKYPLKARSWITKSRLLKTIIIIICVAFVQQIGRILDTTFTSAEIEWEGTCQQVCRQNDAYWVTAIVTKRVYAGLQFGFKAIFVYFIPCSLLIYLTCSMTITIYRSHQIRQKLSKDAPISRSKSTAEQNFNSSTIMLIVDISLFLLPEIPFAAIIIARILSTSFGKHIFDYETFRLLVLSLYMGVACSVPVNFFIFYGMSANFRQACKQLFEKKSITKGNISKRTCTESTVTISSVVDSDI